MESQPIQNTEASQTTETSVCHQVIDHERLSPTAQINDLVTMVSFELTRPPPRFSNDAGSVLEEYPLIPIMVACRPMGIICSIWTSVMYSLYHISSSRCLGPCQHSEEPYSLYACLRNCQTLASQLALASALFPLFFSFGWLGKEVGGAPSFFAPCFPIIILCLSLWNPLCLFWLASILVSTLIWGIAVCLFAKRARLVASLTFTVCMYMAHLVFYNIFYNWLDFTAFWSSLFLACVQYFGSMFAIAFWRRFHGTAPAVLFSMLAPILPIGAEVARLVTFIREANQPDFIRQGLRLLLSGVLLQAVVRNQVVRALIATLTGKTCVLTAEADLILRSYFGFSYVALLTCVVYAGYSLTHYFVHGGADLRSPYRIIFMSVLWLLCTVLTDFCVILSQMLLRKLYYGELETMSSSLRRLWKPHGHVAPRFRIEASPEDPPPPTVSLSAGELRGYWLFNTQQMNSIFLVSFTVTLAMSGMMGVIGW